MPTELLRVSDLPRDPRAHLARRLDHCLERVRAAAVRSRREKGEVRLLPVTKYAGAEVIRLLYEIGLRDFAESRVQDAIAKREALRDLPDLRFHLIGHLQRNKARRAVELFASVQSLDSIRLARELERRIAESGRAAPELWIEVNVSGEEQKTGLSLANLDGLLDAMDELPRVQAALSGLMAMAPWTADPNGARPAFRRLRELRDALVAGGRLRPGSGLSMGMSHDFEVAIEEGATVVRIGTALFEGADRE